jgi:hypothetical protein
MWSYQGTCTFFHTSDGKGTRACCRIPALGLISAGCIDCATQLGASRKSRSTQHPVTSFPGNHHHPYLINQSPVLVSGRPHRHTKSSHADNMMVRIGDYAFPDFNAFPQVDGIPSGFPPQIHSPYMPRLASALLNLA